MSQFALVVNEVGKPLVRAERDIPTPAENQVQVKVTVAGLNPHDQKARDTGLFIADKLPAVLGNDVAGVVTALGPGVSDRRIGDHVVGQSNLAPGWRQSALQEYVVLDVPFTAVIPKGISDDEAATLPTNIIAPLVGLFDDENGLGIPAPWTKEAEAFDYKGQTLLVVGGGSNCGRFGVQLAKLVGIGKIVVVGSKRSENEIKRYGATHVIYRDSEDVLGQIREIVGDDLVYAYDAVNPPEGQLLALNALSNAKKGKLARLLPRPIDESQVKGKAAGFEIKNVVGISHVKAELCGPFWEQLPLYLESGKIIPLSFHVLEGLDAEKVNEELDKHRDGKAVHKIHVHP
jgi:NADPH:quinone reductase-like Zn-dependent oxidoreductase